MLQRCQWHKRENVLAYLPERHRAAMRRNLQAAYEQPTYEAAKRALAKLRAELTLLNASAAASLDEGLEQTLTPHRLGLFAELGLSLKTTNILESIHARVEDRFEAGATMLTIGSSTAMGYHVGLPIKDALVERVHASSSGRCRPRSSTFPARCSKHASTTRTQWRTAWTARRWCSSITVPRSASSPRPR